MQKRGYTLKTVILILMSICPCRYGYCIAQAGLENPYLEFGQMLRNNQKAEAVKLGQDLFEVLVSKYPENISLQELQRRLEVADDLADLITEGLKSRQKKALSNIAGLDVLPELASTGAQREESANLLAPAEQLYLVNLRSFSRKLTIQGISGIESKFLREYYDFRMQNWIETIAGTAAGVMITNPESTGLSYYTLVLPLLYLCEEDSGWGKLELLFTMAGSESLDAMSNFCLLRAERPNAAAAIARHKAKSGSVNFSLANWALSASAECVNNHRPDLAERLLQAAIDDVSDEDKVVELRLKIAENYSICGDNVSAVEKYRHISEDFPGNSLYGKTMASYFACLAGQFKAQQLLAEIDQELEKPQCQSYLPQLMYLKWWALRKTDQHILANRTSEQLIENHGSSLCTAPVLLAHATDALSNGRYKRCRELLVQLTTNFPQTNSAQEAQKILSRLGK